MDAFLRATSIYFFLLLIIRLSGKRTLAEMSTFDLVILLIISETTQQTLLGNDFSVTNAAILITVLIFYSILFSYINYHFHKADAIINGQPIIILKNGKPIQERLDRARVGVDDILESARKLRGLESVDQIQYAILERDGGISIIPKETQNKSPVVM